MSTQFDPFRFNEVYIPEPVEGQLQSVYLVEDDGAMEVGRPRWFRSLALLVVALFLGTTVLTALHRIVSAQTAQEANVPT